MAENRIRIPGGHIEMLATADTAPGWAIGVAKEVKRGVRYYAVRICKDATLLGYPGEGRFVRITDTYKTEAEARKAANAEYRDERKALAKKGTGAA